MGKSGGGMKERPTSNPLPVFAIFIILFVALSFLIQDMVFKGQFNGPIMIVLSIIWLMLLLLCSIPFFYDYFGVFEQLVVFVPFLDLPNILSGLYERGIVENYSLTPGNQFTVRLRGGNESRYPLEGIRVVRAGRVYGSKSSFTMKFGKTWRPFFFEGDGALRCARELQKALGRMKVS